MGKLTLSSFIRAQRVTVPPVLTVDLKGKSVLITGANTGLGFEAAKHFARMNPARLILACRNEQKGLNAAAAIAKDTDYRAEVQLVDLARFGSVDAFAKRSGHDPIDVVVANAGVAQPGYRTTTDGWEETLQVNHLSTALLSFLLLPNLVRAARLHESSSRLVIVSSETFYFAKFNKELLSEKSIMGRLNDKKYCTPPVMAARYLVTKLLNVLFTRAFFQHLAQPLEVIPTAVNPGFCISDIHRNLSLSSRITAKLMELAIGRTGEQGARQLVWAALGPDGKDGPHVKRSLGGAYVSLSEVHEPSDFVISQEGHEAQERIWHETIDILSEAVPSVRGIVNMYFGK